MLICPTYFAISTYKDKIKQKGQVGWADEVYFDEFSTHECHGKLPRFCVEIELRERVILRHSSDTCTTHVGFLRARGHK